MTTPTASLTMVTERDLAVFAALAVSPLTAEQICKISRSFPLAFKDARRVRERMRTLAKAERVAVHRYATSGPGAPAYYTLTPLGHRLLHGHTAALPARHTFGPIGIARQRHANALADFLVHTAVAAHGAGITLANLQRENTVRLQAGSDFLYPDLAFQLLLPDSRAFQFFVEIDCGSERVRSEKDADSWQRKIKFYDAYADESQQRFRVLVVVTGGEERYNILAAAAVLARDPRRSLVYGSTLDAYLKIPEAVTSACWLDHRSLRVPLFSRLTKGSVSATAMASARQSA